MVTPLGVGAWTHQGRILPGLKISGSPDRVRFGGSDHAVEHGDLNGGFLLLSTERASCQLAAVESF